MTSKLSATMRTLQKRGRSAFIPFIMAGDPNLEATRQILAALESTGADVVELGVPFSDPIADGPVIQRAAERALAGGTTLARILEMVGRYRREGGKILIMLFSYFNPVLRYGLKRFAQDAKANGVDGVLIVDLPPEEAEEYMNAMSNHRLEITFLASPTTSESRLKLIDRSSTGFVYYVSRLGVTGKRKDLSDSLESELSRIKKIVRKPVVVGFGISTVEQVKSVARLADGIVVGSTLVQAAEGCRTGEASRRIKTLAEKMIQALRTSSPRRGEGRVRGNGGRNVRHNGDASYAKTARSGDRAYQVHGI